MSIEVTCLNRRSRMPFEKEPAETPAVRLNARCHRFGCYFMPVLEQFFELAPDHSRCKPSPKKSKWQFVFNAIFEAACIRPIRRNRVRLNPALKWPACLHVLKLPPLDVIPMLEFPAQSQRPHPHSQRPAISIANSGRRLNHLDRLPRWRQTQKRSGLRMPTKHNIGRRFNSRGRNK